MTNLTVHEYGQLQDIITETCDSGKMSNGDQYITCSHCDKTYSGNDDFVEFLRHLRNHLMRDKENLRIVQKVIGL